MAQNHWAFDFKIEIKKENHEKNMVASRIMTHEVMCKNPIYCDYALEPNDSFRMDVRDLRYIFSAKGKHFNIYIKIHEHLIFHKHSVESRLIKPIISENDEWKFYSENQCIVMIP